MIDKYYNGVIEQVYSRIGKTEKNIVMACYSNDFSIRELESIKRYSGNEDGIFFAWHEYDFSSLVSAYEPFLDIICRLYREKIGGDFGEFLEKCGVYVLHRPLLESYYETGIARREESILLGEVSYEQERMTEAVAAMLKAVAEVCPLVVVINRFQLAASSVLQLVSGLIKEPSVNIGLVLGVNEGTFRQDDMPAVWELIVEGVEDSSQMYHIGSSGKRRSEDSGRAQTEQDYESSQNKITNTTELLDFDQSKRFFQQIEQRIKFEDITLKDEFKLTYLFMYAKVSVLLGEMSKALELVEEITHLQAPEYEGIINYECAYLIATCYMYQGKLSDALSYAAIAREVAEKNGSEEQIFKAELLNVQTQMSGWYNIFFCVQDIPIDEELIEKLIRYNYKNHLAHIYIYAYDNRPEVVAKAYRSESALYYFSKGVALAKEIGNGMLVHNAYEKNIMLASTNGMNEIAMLYSVRTYEFLKGKDSVLVGRIYSGLGYNLSAIGESKKANAYYNCASDMFYKLKMPEDIAEVYYNRALNNILLGRYEDAEHDLQLSIKAIDKLHLNSLRVCNLSKLYALLALSCILQNDRFNCERYLLSCRQFLNYIIEKEKEKQDIEVIHDYAKSDDDMFLYTFSTALLNNADGNKSEAFANYLAAEKYLLNAEGNQFFAYRLFRTKRMEIFKEFGRTELYEREKQLLEQHEEANRQIAQNVPDTLLEEVQIGDYEGECSVPESDIEALIKQKGLEVDLQISKRQMDFISTWQKMIDVGDMNIDTMISNAMRAFINHFNVDQVLYLRYGEEDQFTELYNDTGVRMTPEIIKGLEYAMKEYPQGFAVSKISDSFFEHQDAISYFGMDNVCSFVAIPFLKNGRLSDLLITYICMKDNWHSSIERYMLNEDDLKIYRLLFREMGYSINRMEASRKVYEMNSKLQAAAVTDVLTGIYNRAGMYEEIARMTEQIAKENRRQGMGLMFIDLDNFKHYNDTFGHDIGDIILKEMANIYRQVCEGHGFASRYGGDEFIIILNTDDRDLLEEMAKEIYRRIDETNGFQKEIENRIHKEVVVDESRRISCSIGISSAPDIRDEESVSQLIQKADDLLYTVKTTEKGHYAFI